MRRAPKQTELSLYVPRELVVEAQTALRLLLLRPRSLVQKAAARRTLRRLSLEMSPR